MIQELQDRVSVAKSIGRNYKTQKERSDSQDAADMRRIKLLKPTRKPIVTDRMRHRRLDGRDDDNDVIEGKQQSGATH